MRSKEDAHDYRYFPDPDLLPLELERRVPRRMPREPARTARRQAPPLRDRTGPLALQRRRADRRGRDRRAGSRRCSPRPPPRPGQARGRSRQAGRQLAAVGAVRRAQQAGQEPRELAGLARARAAELLAPGRRGHDLGLDRQAGASRRCSRPATAPTAIVEREGLKQTSDTGAIEAAIDEVLAANADKVEQYRGGKDALFGFFVGQTMKAMQGKGNPQLVNEVLNAKLG